jgi:hypothetical protein
MIEIKINKEQNFLLVEIVEIISNTDISTGVVNAGHLLPELKENYTLITDISKFKQTSPDQGALFNKIVKSMDEKLKIGLIIRVVGDSKTNIEHFCKMDKLFKFDNVRYVPTIKDAMGLIESGDIITGKPC